MVKSINPSPSQSHWLGEEFTAKSHLAPKGKMAKWNIHFFLYAGVGIRNIRITHRSIIAPIVLEIIEPIMP